MILCSSSLQNKQTFCASLSCQQLLPLASQASDVTYADLHFNKRDVKPDAEVVYAEVKVGRKQMKEPWPKVPKMS